MRQILYVGHNTALQTKLGFCSFARVNHFYMSSCDTRDYLYLLNILQLNSSILLQSPLLYFLALAVLPPCFSVCAPCFFLVPHTLIGVLERSDCNSFDNFAGLVGGVCAVPLALIYPAAFQLRLMGGTLSPARRAWAYTVLCVGVFSATLCTWQSISTWK